MRRIPIVLMLAVLAAALSACPPELAQRGVQAPQFEIVPDRPAELRILPPSAERPFGALAVRLWARVTNPNPYGMTLLRVWGDLNLEGTRAAEVDFPLGVPLPARGEAIVPLDVIVDPRDVPEIAPVVTRAILGQHIGYELVGRFTVDAGALGTPTFGPMTLLSGTMQTRR